MFTIEKFVVVFIGFVGLVWCQSNNDMDKFMADISSSFDGLGDSIRQHVDQRLSPLDNMGTRIEEQVEHALEPVRAMEINNKMMNGIGGTTIAYFNGVPRLLIYNRKTYTCSDNIVESPYARCTGVLQPFKAVAKQDYCFANSYSTINDKLCISGSDDMIMFSMVNGEYECRSNSDEPALFIDLEEYKRMCGRYPSQVLYKYFADLNDPQHVEIPNNNKAVKCLNNQVGICEFMGLPKSGNSNVYISNVNVYRS